MAGNQNHDPDPLSEVIAKIAPIIGPMMKPSEKAIPTNAIPLARFFAFETSVMTAILSDIFPLLNPPTNRAKTKRAKLFENAHNKYDNDIPV